MDDRLKEIYQDILKNTPQQPVVDNSAPPLMSTTTTSEKPFTASKYLKIFTILLTIIIIAYFTYKCFCEPIKRDNTNHIQHTIKDELINTRYNTPHSEDDEYEESEDDGEYNDPLFQSLE